MDITANDYGTMPDGSKIISYTLENDNGVSIRIMNYGGIITHIMTPDKNGQIDDVVLGFNNLQDYLGSHPYFGAIIGRCANRIAKGSFVLDGVAYSLAVNNGPNHLHGGIVGFDKKVWLAVRNITTEFVSLKLGYESPDGEESYPGNLMVEVEYVLNNQNELVINYTAQTDKKTHVNLTNHSYFNLNGGKGDVLGYSLQIDSDYVLEPDKDSIPTGKILPVADTAFDFRTAKDIGSDIAQVPPGYDHNFILNGNPKQLRKFARVEDPVSGRTLEVLTTEPGVQLYTANYIDSIDGKDGLVYKKHSGFCLETQHYPDSPNQQNFPSTVLLPGEIFMSTTIYRFGTIS